jgi:hypothetical protein
MQIRNQSLIALEGILIVGFRVRVLVRRLLSLAVVPRGGRAVVVACLTMKSVLKICSVSSLAAAVVWEWAAVVSEVVLLVRLCTPSSPSKSLQLTNFTGGGLFDGPGFVFNMGGGPGVRVHQFGGGAPRRRPQQAPRDPNAPPPTLMQSLQSLLPLLLLFIFPLLSGLFSGNGTPSGPSVKLQSTPPFTQQRVSNGFGIPYYVDPREVSDLTTRKWKELDKRADSQYFNKMSQECEVQQQRRQQMYQQAQGFFFTDQDKLQKARNMEMPSCKRLNDLGYRT